MSLMDQEYLNQLAWEYVLKVAENVNDPEVQEIHKMMVSSFGYIDTKEAIKEMKSAAKLMGINIIEMRWYHGITVRNPRSILSGHFS
jgi:hypothetical protein